MFISKKQFKKLESRVKALEMVLGVLGDPWYDERYSGILVPLVASKGTQEMQIDVVKIGLMEAVKHLIAHCPEKLKRIKFV